MIHPSYTDLMEVVNSEVEPGEQPVVQSRYSIVLATAKRARQITEELYENNETIEEKPVKTAVEELASGKCKIVSTVPQNNE